MFSEPWWTLFVALLSVAFGSWLSTRSQTRLFRDENDRRQHQELRKLYAQMAARWHALFDLVSWRERTKRVNEQGNYDDLDRYQDDMMRIRQQYGIVKERFDETCFELDMAEDDQTRRSLLFEFIDAARDIPESEPGAAIEKARQVRRALLDQVRHLGRWQRRSRSTA